jgi:hypothetical protein
MSRLIPVLLAALLVLPLGASRSDPGQDAGGIDGTAALKGFNERIAAYAAVHHRLEQSLPPLSSSSRRSALLNRTFLAAAIKAARPQAKQGDIFTMPVALMFRSRLVTALAGRDTEAFLRELFEEHPGTEGYHVKVYEPYPDWASHEVPTIFLQVLPTLPEDVEYRLLGRDLVLWDIHADLVIDVLIDAIPTRNGRDAT